jgi:hypothetical protein
LAAAQQVFEQAEAKGYTCEIPALPDDAEALRWFPLPGEGNDISHP